MIEFCEVGGYTKNLEKLQNGQNCEVGARPGQYVVIGTNDRRRMWLPVTAWCIGVKGPWSH